MEYNSAYHSGLEASYARQKTKRALHLVVHNKSDNKLGFVDRLQSYLEKEDIILEQAIGYGLCAVTILYLVAGAVRIVLL